MKLEYTITRYEKLPGKLLTENTLSHGWRLDFHIVWKIYRYFWGESIRVLPGAPLPDPGEVPKHGVLVGINQHWVSTNSKDGLWDSLKTLDSVIRSPGKQRVLIRGEPGSGKEVFSTAIHFGSMRKNSGEEGLSQRSIANMRTEDLRELLYGRMVDGVRIPGLIEKTDGGTLFLDEFDKISEKGFYSELLRVLEASEYIPVNGKEIMKVGEVSWVFAGAFAEHSTSKTIGDLPPDFWSRLSAHIKLPNPIKSEELGEHSYAAALFIYFFVARAVEISGGVQSFERKESIDAAIANTLVRGFDEIALGQHLDLLQKKFDEEIHKGMFWFAEVLVSKKPKRTAIYWCEDDEEKKKIFETWAVKNTLNDDESRSQGYGSLKPGFDGVRAVRQAAIGAFDRMLREAKANLDLWDNASSPNKELILRTLAENSADRAAKLVKLARPGQDLSEAVEMATQGESC